MRSITKNGEGLSPPLSRHFGVLLSNKTLKASKIIYRGKGFGWFEMSHLNYEDKRTLSGTQGESQRGKKKLIKTYVFLQLSFSPSTPMNSHVRVICLLVSLLLACCGLAVVCGLLGASYGMHTLSFMAAEVRTTSTMLSTDDCRLASLNI